METAVIPIPMVLLCPMCGMQHIDKPDDFILDEAPSNEPVEPLRFTREPWTNPPHRSHLCHNCGCIWRPADVATVGVAKLDTAGKADSWAPGNGAVLESPTEKQRKLRELADRIDHEELWRWAGMDHHKMSPEQRDRMNAGVELRRFAELWAPGRWLVFPPVGPVRYSASTLDKAVEMARKHEGI